MKVPYLASDNSEASGKLQKQDQKVQETEFMPHEEDTSSSEEEAKDPEDTQEHQTMQSGREISKADDYEMDVAPIDDQQPYDSIRSHVTCGPD